MKRNNREPLFGGRVAGHVQSFESSMSDFEFSVWLDELTDLNIIDLEALFRQQVRFFSGSSSSYRGRGADYDEDLPINRILWMTQDLQLEMIDIALLRGRLDTSIVESGLESARNVISKRR